MGTNEFLHWGYKSVTVKFDCDKCGGHVVSEEISIPMPNYGAERSSDSHNVDEGFAHCEGCSKEFNVSVFAGYADAYVQVEDIADDEIVVHAISDEREFDNITEYQIEVIIESGDFINTFNSEISKLKSLNDLNLDDVGLQEILQRQIYSGAISCLEDYLSTMVIQEVLNKEEYFKRFVKTFPSIKNRKFDLSEIYHTLDKIRDIVKFELVGVIYHDLPKVKAIYQNTLKIEFPEFSELRTIITTRHDMIHRNGKSKDGKKIELSREFVYDVIRKVEEFVKDIDHKLMNR